MEKNRSKLAQSSDQMFERNIAIIASRQQEIKIFSSTFVYEGFICGLDEEWIQLYGHEEDDNNSDTMWRFLLVSRRNISAIGSTGRDLNDVDQVTAEWIGKKINVFSNSVASKFAKSRSTGDGREAH